MADPIADIQKAAAELWKQRAPSTTPVWVSPECLPLALKVWPDAMVTMSDYPFRYLNRPVSLPDTTYSRKLIDGVVFVYEDGALVKTCNQDELRRAVTAGEVWADDGEDEL